MIIKYLIVSSNTIYTGIVKHTPCKFANGWQFKVKRFKGDKSYYFFKNFLISFRFMVFIISWVVAHPLLAVLTPHFMLWRSGRR